MESDGAYFGLSLRPEGVGAMIISIFTIFVATYLLRGLVRGRAFLFLVLVSLLAFGQLAQKTLWAILVVFLGQQIVVWAARRWKWQSAYLPLAFATFFIVVHHLGGERITGVSYIVLAASLDLWARVRRPESFWARDALLNLVLFPKVVVGPIAGIESHSPRVRGASEIAFLGLGGAVKALLLTSLFREYFPAPDWGSLVSVADYLWFGLWNYIHLYLEFSGACDMVTATFWSLGLDCPLNFAKPYLSCSITEFWKRWHITLSSWIKNFVYIPFGGSRVSSGRIYFNLMLAMVISGAWHGLTPSFLGWGALQGALLCLERFFGAEEKLKVASPQIRALAWLVTQALVTCSWVLFFAPLRW